MTVGEVMLEESLDFELMLATGDHIECAGRAAGKDRSLPATVLPGILQLSRKSQHSLNPQE